MVKKKSCQNICRPRVLSAAERDLYGWAEKSVFDVRNSYGIPDSHWQVYWIVSSNKRVFCRLITSSGTDKALGLSEGHVWAMLKHDSNMACLLRMVQGLVDELGEAW
ncbi:hypothetical protein PIB30_036092 [Stylosanthes scabra]|uniref:Uncharacterized protein n=1 Tax=Stylosanthes scabra TaxID=79078 RepID=A0ABU6TD14_9FABA|nr:hypothetical protein [Stylosanthes scabra]